MTNARTSATNKWGRLWHQTPHTLGSLWQAWQRHTAWWARGLVGTAIATLALPAVVAQAWPNSTGLLAAQLTAVGVSVGGMAVVWATLMFNVLRQNQAQLARTVPGHVQALRFALCLAAWAASLWCGLASYLAGGPVLLVMLGMGVVNTAMACTTRWPWLWWALPLVGLGLSWGLQPADINQAVAACLTPHWPLAASATLVMMGLLCAVVFTGGAAHERADARLMVNSNEARGQAADGVQGMARFGMAMPRARWAWWAYTLWLRRVLARPSSTVGARLALGMGPPAHWTSAVASVVWVLLLAVVVVLIGQRYPDWEAGHAMLGGVVLSMVMTSLSKVLQWPAALWASRHEQALLRLLPGVPQGTALNRWLAWRLAGTPLALVAGQGLAVLWVQATVTSSAGDAGVAGMVEVALCAQGLCLLLVLTLWRDWSRTQAPTGRVQVALPVVTALVAGVSTTWVYALDGRWWVLTAWAMLALVVLGMWRWREVVRAPVAWPTGRLSSPPPARQTPPSPHSNH